MTALDVVRDGHRLFRATLLAFAYPGRPVPVPTRPGRDLARAVLEANWPHTAPIAAADPTLLPAGHAAVGDADADVLLVDGPSSHGRLLDARRGTEEVPENGATAIYVVDPAERTEARLSGPGIDGTSRVRLPFSAGELADRAVCCARPPLGVDLLAVVGGALVGLPRTSGVEVIG